MPAKKELDENLQQSKFSLHPSDWFILPLGILTIYAWYHVITMPIDFRMGLFSVWYQNILFHPSVALLAIAIFGSLSIYRRATRKDLGGYARNLSYFFATLTVIYLFILFTVAVSSGSEPTCIGIMGAKITCAETTHLQAYLLLLNPFSMLFWGILSAIGIAKIFTKIKKDK